MTGRSTTTGQKEVPVVARSFQNTRNLALNPLLTEDALRTHCDGLNDVAPCADARVEEDGKLALFCA